jgi:hypothetical protein
MTEYDPHDPHGDEHDLTPHVDLPDHHGDETFSEHPLPPLDDLGHADTPPPAELHFPGEDVTHDLPAADVEPSAPWPDDDQFSHWLAAPDHTGAGDDPASDAQLRDQLAAPPEGPDGLPSPDALVDWTLRQLGDS